MGGKKKRSEPCGLQQDETSPSNELWRWLKRRWQLIHCLREQTRGLASAWESQLIALWSLSSRSKAEMWAPTARHTGFSRSSVCSLHGSSQLIKNALLQKQKEQKCWGNLKDGSCAMYRNCDDSKSSLQASLPGNQNLMMFRLLPNFWHLRPCDCNGCSHIPVFFADNVFTVL